MSSGGTCIGLHDIKPPAMERIIRDQIESAPKKEERFQTLNDNLHERIQERENFEEATMGKELKMIELGGEMAGLKERIRLLESKQ